MARKVINVVYKVDDKELLKAKTSIQGVEKETKDAEKEMLDLDKAIKKTGRDGAKEMNSFGRAIDTISFAAITAGALALGKEIFDITAEFQKFSAVLTNTLGSKSEAKKAMKDIQIFASQTPFAVTELTSSFVKLANQGFRPTIIELRKLGDLASAMGKGFDQLTEAIIDAQTGEFERLKEFGIRAAKEGDKVTFTFKGIQTQTDFTADSIRKYILSLGDLEGVSGGMAAISETLGGKVSNLGDNFDSLFNSIGNQNSGVIGAILDLANNAIGRLNEVLDIANGDPIFEKATENAESYRLALDAAFKEFEAGKGPEALNKALAENVKATNDWKESAKELKDQLADKDQVIKGGLLPDYNRLVTVQKAEAKTVELLSELTQEYIKKINAYVPVVKEMTSEEKKLFDKRQKMLAEIASQTETPIDFAGLVMPDEENYNELTKAVDKVYDIVKTGNEQIHQENVNAGISELEERKRIINEREKLEEQAAEQIKQLQIQLARELLSNLLMENTISTDSINEKYDREIEAAGDNEDAKKEIRKREQIELKRIEEENIKIQKENAIRGIGISTAEAIVKTFVKYGFTIAGIKAAALMAAIGVVQAANVRKYKDGGINIDGPGSSTSDSIPAFLSKGESVINASATSRSQNLLEAINDRKIDDSILYKLSSNGGRQAGFDDSGIIDAINKNKVDYIKQGYSLHEVMTLGKSFKRTIRSQVQGY